jgi:hypothetical protein
MNDVRLLHYSKSETVFKERLNSFRENYNKGKTKTFYDYMNKTWFKGPFTKWKVCDSPSGYNKTNNPIESFNSSIKRTFTMRKRLSVAGLIERLGECIKYYSNSNQKFSSEPKPTKKMIKAASKLVKKDFKKYDKNRVQLREENFTRTIDLKNGNCTCTIYRKHAICKHLIAANEIFKLDLYKTLYLEKYRTFVLKNKRGRRKKATPALDRD